MKVVIPVESKKGDDVQKLELTEVSSGYGGNEVIHKISLKITEPSIYVVLGPNGAGKTTLFRTIGGILKPTSGQIMFDDVDLFYSKEGRKNVTYLSHLNALPEEMTVSNALKYYADIEGGDVENVLNLLNLGDLKDKKYVSLSQGQKKRVSVGKIFLRERDLYLLDEPTSNMDPKISKEIRDILIKLSADKFVLYSSHNLYEAREIGTYLILIKNGELKFFDKIENVKTKQYRVGIKSLNDISKLLPESTIENGYYVVTVDGPKMVANIVSDLVRDGAELVEIRELDNPLQEFFEE
ncbi:MAG TPA: ABC transporter ATP-binding protein [Candidatus Bathyarchaeia archaeon]|nr:ABC transporter ATP-binding protein [Candidatus Bathyarchaeia archaeon]